MQTLDLYATIEEYLDFEEEIHHLYKTIGTIAISKEPKKLIDIGCGQGEFCHILNHNKISTLGVDLSAKQIDIAKQKDINAKCIDIKDIDEKFDCATAVFDVLNYIKSKDLKSFIQNTYNLLEKNGYFIFDINTLYGFQEIAQGTLSIDNDDNFIVIDANFQDETLYTDITFFTQENKLYKKQNGTIEQYYHSKEDLSTTLKNVGFNIKEIIDFNLHSDDIADKLIFICKKD